MVLEYTYGTRLDNRQRQPHPSRGFHGQQRRPSRDRLSLRRHLARGHRRLYVLPRCGCERLAGRLLGAARPLVADGAEQRELSSLNDLVQYTSIQDTSRGASLAGVTASRIAGPRRAEQLLTSSSRTLGSGKTRLVSTTASATSPGSVIAQPTAWVAAVTGSSASVGWASSSRPPQRIERSSLRRIDLLDPYNDTDSATSSPRY